VSRFRVDAGDTATLLTLLRRLKARAEQHCDESVDTSQMQRVVDARGDSLSPSTLARVAPIAFGHINMRGVFGFGL
jgi:hypothetical protein